MALVTFLFTWDIDKKNPHSFVIWATVAIQQVIHQSQNLISHITVPSKLKNLTQQDTHSTRNPDTICLQWSHSVSNEMKHFRCFDLLLTGLHNAEFECWPHVDPSLDRPSHISHILVFWIGCCVCGWDGHLYSEMTPASVTVKCVNAS